MDSDETIARAKVEIVAEMGSLNADMEVIKLKTKEVDDRITDLKAKFASNAIGAGAYADSLAKLSQQKARLELQSVQASNGVFRLGERMKELESGSGRAGQKLLQFARVADDSQYLFQNGMGLRPIINNMMEIAPAIGIGMLAIDLLVRHWDKFSGILGEGSTLTEADRMAKLAEKTNRTAEETAQLNKMKKEQAEIEQMMQKRTQEQESAEKQVESIITESGAGGMTGGEVVRKGIAETLASRGDIDRTGLSEAEAGHMANVERQVRLIEKARDKAMKVGRDDPNFAEAQKFVADSQLDINRLKRSTPGGVLGARSYDEIQAALATKQAERAQKMMLDAQKDPRSLANLIKLVETNPGAFPKDFAAQLREATPEGREAAAGDDEWEKMMLDTGGKRTSAAMRRAEQRRKREADDMAKAMQDRLSREVFGGATIDEGRIRKELETVMPADEAAKRAPRVLRDLDEQFTKRFRERMLSLGVSGEAGFATARDEILREIREEDEKKDAHKTPAERAQAEAQKKRDREVARAREEYVREQARDMGGVFGPDIAADLLGARGPAEAAEAAERRRVAADLKRGGLARPGTEEDIAREMVEDGRRRADQMRAAVGRFGPAALRAGRRSRFAPKPKRTGRAAAAARPRAGATHHAAASGSKAERLLEQIAAAATKQAAQGEDAARALDTLASI